MKNTIYYLATCDTCRRILKEIQAVERGFILHDIKTQPLTESVIDQLKALAGSYAQLFNKRARKYKEYGLDTRELTEADYRKWLLEEYTFLKRPVVVYEGKLFVGNDRKTLERLQEILITGV